MPLFGISGHGLSVGGSGGSIWNEFVLVTVTYLSRNVHNELGPVYQGGDRRFLP